MRKEFVLFIAAIALCACDRNPFTPKSATLYCGDSIRITTKGATSGEMLESTQPFVASVNVAGWVKAKHVGSAAITAATYILSDGSLAYDANKACQITVKPRHTHYTESLTDWNMTKEDVMEKLGKPTEMQVVYGVGALLYGNPETDKYVTYYIIEDYKLTWSVIMTEQLTEKELRDFLNERYYTDSFEDEIDDELNEYFYYNSDNEDEIDMVIQLDNDKVENYCEVVYYKYEVVDFPEEKPTFRHLRHQ